MTGSDIAGLEELMRDLFFPIKVEENDTVLIKKEEDDNEHQAVTLDSTPQARRSPEDHDREDTASREGTLKADSPATLLGDFETDSPKTLHGNFETEDSPETLQGDFKTEDSPNTLLEDSIPHSWRPDFPHKGEPHPHFSPGSFSNTATAFSPGQSHSNLLQTKGRQEEVVQIP